MKKRILSAALALLLFANLPLTALAEEYDLADGSIEVSASDDGSQYVSQTGVVSNEKQTTATVIFQTGSDTTTTTNTVTVHADAGQTAQVTLAGVNIDVSGTGEMFVSGSAAVSTSGAGDVIIELEDENTVRSGTDRAGLEKNNTGSLTITDTGNDGSLDATGGDYGAGIGSGYGKDVSDIVITGGQINATGGVNGAGIGSGWSGDGNNITISGGKVDAKGGDDGSGIGSGFDGGSSNITLTGGEVTAKGSHTGVGIGSSRGKKVENVKVYGDTYLKVQGGDYGVAIGSGGYKNGSFIPGEDVDPDVSGLTVEGSIEYYAPDADMTADEPQKIIGHEHQWDKGVITTQPTCTQKGVKTYTCQAGNDFTRTEDIPMLKHEFWEYVSDNNATCEQDGTKTAKCMRYGTGGCTATHTVTDIGSKLVHTVVIDHPVAATYTSTGLTEGSHCGMCGKVFTEQKVTSTIPPYQVTNSSGMSIRYKAQQSRNVLTIMIDEDSAVLTGKLSGISALKAQGVEKIIFVTTGATSTFATADLLKQGAWGETYHLTHNGSTITFTLGEPPIDVSGILEKT